VQSGATRTNGDLFALQSGGGVWANSTNAAAVNCLIISNAASFGGGGCYAALCQNCQVLTNWSSIYGGGAYRAALVNCLVGGNSAPQGGGGAYDGTLVNCTVVGNVSPFGGGIRAVSSCVLENCIVYNNFIFHIAPGYLANWTGPASFSYCCTTPLPGGAGNITADPQLLDGVHIATISPCRGAGSALCSSGTDIDGEAWANPPSMGCDEVWEADLIGPLLVRVAGPSPSPVARGFSFMDGTVTGRASRVAWSFGDGSVLTNESHVSVGHTWTNAGDYTLTFTAYNTDNPGGVSTNLLVHVVPLVIPVLSTSGFSQTNFTVSFASQASVTYILEQTTNLAPPAVWQGVTSGYGTGGLLQLTDSHATNLMQFYRVRIP
jgi:hypothetical protein